ncbi:MAG: HEAT repeat domain-containing protein [Cyanobacteria bacterium]|nr:HEAT repeat domain-containing protein [Cyanobacteriota bacterium]
MLTGCGSGVIPQLLETLKSRDWKVKVIAAHTLGLYGKQAQSVISELSSLMQDENADVRFAAAKALGKIGSKEVVSALAQALQDKDENVRFASAEALVKVGTDAKDAIPALTNTLRDGNWFVRSRAANAFVHLAPQSSSLQPKLINAALVNQLQESPWGGGQEYVEYHLKRQQKIPAVVAFDALAEVGSEVAPSLIASLTSSEIFARVPKPTLALINIGSKIDSDRIVSLLIQSLHNPDWAIRQNAIHVLGGIGSKAAIPDLVNIAPSWWGEKPDIALGQIGFRLILGKKRVSYKQEQVKKFIPVLVAALRNEDWQIRVVATAALGLIPSEVSTIPFIGESLRDQDWRVRSTAATTLGKIYVYSDKNILNKIYLDQKTAYLKYALQDKDWRVRRK